ncbi:nucleotidyltransferase domain-containing protein [Halobacillus sp. H74]|uniref:nucleotidyltransferase domain-containing protein n=1 Tax=Halobacillus sp. H74 TaxID=3457436 RepID=UPI003FCD132A
MRQTKAVEAIVHSLREDNLVEAVFLKGSMARGEEDENSDVDLYVLVEEENKAAFLQNRKKHLESYQSIIFYDDIFIIAPQIIVVYENLLHVDLFTVTEKTLVHKDYFKVLYDPARRMDRFQDHQNLWLSQKDFHYAVEDVAFFLLQYKKAADRGNDFWAVKVANDLGINIAKVLLQRYCPERAQLGLKTIDRTLPVEVVEPMRIVYRHLSAKEHPKAVYSMALIIQDHIIWLSSQFEKEKYTIPFLKRMLNETIN